MRFRVKRDYRDTLAHHGVQGMKWGVWNDETAARYNGSSTKKKKTVPNVTHDQVIRAMSGHVKVADEYYPSKRKIEIATQSIKEDFKDIDDSYANMVGTAAASSAMMSEEYQDAIFQLMDEVIIPGLEESSRGFNKDSANDQALAYYLAWGIFCNVAFDEED